MARETKVGLLIGLALILLVGIILSDLMTAAGPESDGAVTEFADDAQAGIFDDAHTPFATDSAYDARFERPTFEEPRQETRETIPQPPTRSSEPTPRDSFPEIESAEAAANPEPLAQLPQAWRVASAKPRASVLMPGNDIDRSGISAFETPAPLKPERVAPAYIHYVQAGETLATIARQHYGNPTFGQAIALFNPDLVNAEGNVHTGLRLEIPPLGSPVFSRMFEPVHSEHAARLDADNPMLPDRSEAKRIAASTKTILVEPGQTLSEIAQQHLGSANDWRRILDANRDTLEAPEKLRAGMELTIPLGDDAPTQPLIASTDRSTPAELKPRAERGSASETPARTRSTYTVKAGDNLTRIARSQLGDGDRWRDLLAANSDLLSSADQIYVGMTLRLPTTDSTGDTAAARTPVPATPQTKTYTVKAGDNLTRIAERTLGRGDRWDDLLAANSDKLSDPRELQAGMVLRIP